MDWGYSPLFLVSLSQRRRSFFPKLGKYCVYSQTLSTIGRVTKTTSTPLLWSSADDALGNWISCSWQNSNTWHFALSDPQKSVVYHLAIRLTCNLNGLLPVPPTDAWIEGKWRWTLHINWIYRDPRFEALQIITKSAVKYVLKILSLRFTVHE